MIAVAGAQTPHGGVRGRRGDNTYAQGDQGLEEVAEHGPGQGPGRLSVPVEEGGDVQAEESGGQGGVGQVAFGTCPNRFRGCPVGA